MINPCRVQGLHDFDIFRTNQMFFDLHFAPRFYFAHFIVRFAHLFTSKKRAQIVVSLKDNS